MNADEIVMILRGQKGDADFNFYDGGDDPALITAATLNAAADLIESLQNDVFKYKALSESLKKECGRLMTANDDLKVRLADVTARNERLANDYSEYSGSALERADELVESLENSVKQSREQLSASQARERAAAELIDKIDLALPGAYSSVKIEIRRWRKQQAGKGEAK